MREKYNLIDKVYLDLPKSTLALRVAYDAVAIQSVEVVMVWNIMRVDFCIHQVVMTLPRILV